MAKHTRKPWYRSANGQYVRYDMPPHLTGANICDLSVFGGPREEGEANGDLIIAAPDLLAACKALLEDLPYACDTNTCECGENDDGTDDKGNPCCHIMACRAVAKATNAKG